MPMNSNSIIGIFLQALLALCKGACKIVLIALSWCFKVLGMICTQFADTMQKIILKSHR
jgi:hypothetical protein